MTTTDKIDAFLSEHGETIRDAVEQLHADVLRGIIEKRRHEVILKALEGMDFSEGAGSIAAAALAIADHIYPLPPRAPAKAKAAPDAAG